MQAEQYALPWPPIPVVMHGVSEVRRVPNRRLVVTVVPLGATPTRVLDADDKRAVAHLVADQAWSLSSTPSGVAALWPASVPLTITSAGALYARAGSSDTLLTVIIEVWAD